MGLTADIDPVDARIPIDGVFDAWALIMRSLQDPAFPVRVGASRKPADYGVYGFLLMTSNTLGEALTRTAQYVRVVSDGFHWQLEIDGDDAHLILEPHGPLTLGRRCVHECANVEFVGMCRHIFSGDFTPTAIRFAHSSPHSIDAHTKYFGLAPTFEQPRTEVVFHKRLLEAPMPKAEPAFCGYFAEEAERKLSVLGGAPVSASVRWLLGQSKAEVSMDVVARRLGMSRRTLHRRLREEDTTFDAVATSTRHALAVSYVAGDRIPLAEVAYLLGFSEPSAFHRAFKRWTGMTPRDYRRVHHARR